MSKKASTLYTMFDFRNQGILKTELNFVCTHQCTAPCIDARIDTLKEKVHDKSLEFSPAQEYSVVHSKFYF